MEQRLRYADKTIVLPHGIDVVDRYEAGCCWLHWAKSFQPSSSSTNVSKSMS
jgi:hypothetical protein